MTTAVKVFRGDCREVLPTLEADSVDCIIADPPYGVTSLAWDTAVDGWLEGAAHVLKPSGSMWLFGSMRSLMALGLRLGGWTLAQDIVWEKHNGSSFHADRFRRVHEHVIHLYRGRWADVYRAPQYTMDATKRTLRRKARPPHTGHIGEGTYASEDGGPRLMRSVLYVRSCHGAAMHPTQKPVELLVPLIRYSCPPEGTVCDPFMGSGSTGVAAIQTGRSFVGIEIDQDVFELAKLRLSAVQAALWPLWPGEEKPA